LLRRIRPKACQWPIDFQPQSAGISQFHKLMTTKPSTKSTATNSATSVRKESSGFSFLFLPRFRKFVVDRLEPAGQVNRGVMRESSVFTLMRLRMKLRSRDRSSAMI
jgi:hypothetical protein